MKKFTTLAAIFVGLLAIAVAVVFWPTTPRGEYRSNRGSVYFFSDGIVAIDRSRSPSEVYIYADGPKEIAKAEIREDGLWVHEVGGNLSIGFSRPNAGMVRVIESNVEGTDGRQLAIAPEEIRTFISWQEWDSSVHQLLKK